MQQKIQLKFSELYEDDRFYESKSEIFGLNLIQDECLINNGKDEKFFSIKNEK